MFYRYCLLILSVLFSCTAFAQENTVNKPQEPILGYYHLGMNFDEYWDQTQKMKEATEVSDSSSLLLKYLISINGITFDVDNIISPAADITASDNENYTKGTLPLFFTGHDYFLENKLVSVTITTPHYDINDNLCYIPAGLYEQQHLPKNQCMFGVYNIELHNQLVSLTETLESYLSKKYGTPTKKYPIAKLQPLRKKRIVSSIPCLLVQLMRFRCNLAKSRMANREYEGYNGNNQFCHHLHIFLRRNAVISSKP